VKPTKDDIIDHLQTALWYVRANLANRKRRPGQCRDDDGLVSHITHALTLKGVEGGAALRRRTRK
jgi:hypothetical protein